jgi:hypothetical protein
MPTNSPKRRSVIAGRKRVESVNNNGSDHSQARQNSVTNRRPLLSSDDQRKEPAFEGLSLVVQDAQRFLAESPGRRKNRVSTARPSFFRPIGLEGPVVRIFGNVPPTHSSVRSVSFGHANCGIRAAVFAKTNVVGASHNATDEKNSDGRYSQPSLLLFEHRTAKQTLKLPCWIGVASNGAGQPRNF